MIGRWITLDSHAGLFHDHSWRLQVHRQHLSTVLPVTVLSGCDHRLPASPRGLYEVRVAIQTSQEPYSLQYQLFEGLKNGTEISRGNEVTILSAAGKETESLQEFDFLDDVLPAVDPLCHPYP